MRYRLLATYQGAPYEAGLGPTDSDIVLFAACPPPEDLRFEPATGHWRKTVSRNDVRELHESRPLGTFRGERCIVLDDLGDRLHIVYHGHDAYRAEQLGYWEIDRGVFELVTPRHEVTDIVEQRLVFPSASDEVPEVIQAPTWAGPSSADAGPPAALAADVTAPARTPLDDDPAGVAVPMPTETPLPLEAQARAASARRHPRSQPVQGSGSQVSGPVDQPAGISAPLPASPPSPENPAAAVPSWTPHQPAAAPAPRDLGPAELQDIGAPPDVAPEAAAPQAATPDLPAPPHRRRATKRRMPTQRIFSDLADQAAIPATAYAIGEDVDGAMCLIQTEEGYEVFTSVAGARHEVRAFPDEESAYFYLFGVLAAEALRTGALGPRTGVV